MKSIIILLWLAFSLGTVASAQKISNDKVPAAAQQAFKAKFPNVTDVKWEMEKVDLYEASFKLDNQKMTATFNKDGKWMETENNLDPAKLPQAILKTISKEFPGSKINESVETESPDKGKYFEVILVKGKGKYEVELTAEGQILEKKELKKKEDKD